jgi:hypothetical protein
MVKKLSLVLAAVAVLAFAVPAFASATTGLTMEGALGTLIPTGKKVEFVNVGNIVLTSTKTGNITCEEMTVTGEVTTNTTKKVVVTGKEFSANNKAAKCHLENGTAVTVPSIELEKVETEGKEVAGTEGKDFTFIVAFKPTIGTLTCTYTTTTGTGHYIAGTDVLTTERAALTVTPAACGTTTTLDGKFTLQTDPTSETPGAAITD